MAQYRKRSVSLMFLIVLGVGFSLWKMIYKSQKDDRNPGCKIATREDSDRVSQFIAVTRKLGLRRWSTLEHNTEVDLFKEHFPGATDLMLKMLKQQSEICKHDKDSRTVRWNKDIIQIALTLWNRYSIMLSYSFAMGYPLGSYLEYPFLVLQDHVVLGLIFHTRSMLSIKLLLGFLLYIIVYLCIGYHLLPSFIMSFVMSLCTPLGIFSKSAQIIELYKRKDPGRLSITTWSIAAYGCYVRILTSLFQTKDIFMVTNFLSGALLNTTIIAMIIYYSRQRKSKLY